MFYSIIVYTSLMLAMMLCGIIASKRESYHRYRHLNEEQPFFCWENILPILLFTFIFGFRYNVGIDYKHYLSNYMMVYSDENSEFLFFYITSLFKKLDIHYSLYFTLFSFLQIFFLYYAFKKERYLYPFLIFILFCGQYAFLWTNVIRQDIAACIFIFAVKYITQKDIVRYLLCIAIATGFHTTAIILLFFYPISYINKDFLSKRWIQYFLLALVLYLSYRVDLINSIFTPIFGPFVQNLGYEETYENVISRELGGERSIESNTGLGATLLLIIDVIIIYYSNKLKSYYNSKTFNIYYLLYFIGILAHELFSGLMIILRAFRYFRFFKMIIVAYLLYYLLKKRGVTNTWVLIILSIIYLAIYASLFVFGHKNELMYQNILF